MTTARERYQPPAASLPPDAARAAEEALAAVLIGPALRRAEKARREQQTARPA